MEDLKHRKIVVMGGTSAIGLFSTGLRKSPWPGQKRCTSGAKARRGLNDLRPD